jgi:hypothetical protein
VQVRVRVRVQVRVREGLGWDEALACSGKCRQ